MASSFPEDIDSFAVIGNDTLLNSVSANHKDIHNELSDAIMATQIQLGVTNSTDETSFEYRLRGIEAVAGLTKVLKTSAEWEQQNSVLLATQIGIESDTMRFKFGNGEDDWLTLIYANVTTDVLESSLEDYIPIGDRGNPDGVASLGSDGLIPDSEIPSSIARDSELSSHSSTTTNIHGISDTSLLATKSYSDNAVSTHNSDTTSVHGISDTAELATKTYSDNGISTHNSDTTNVHGISDTSVLLTTSGGTVQNLTITGNLTVQGTTTTVDTTNLDVTDSLIYLASEQFDTDVLDIGIFGAYGDIQSGHLHTGLVRDASDGVWKLVSNASEPTDSELDFTGVTYDTLKVGGLEVGSVSNTEIGYLDGVTSSIQTQIDSKANKLIQFNLKTEQYIIELSDNNKIVEINSASATNLGIPEDESAFPVGFSVTISQTGAGQITVFQYGTPNVTINGTPGLKLREQWSTATLVKRDSTHWHLFGDLSA